MSELLPVWAWIAIAIMVIALVITLVVIIRRKPRVRPETDHVREEVSQIPSMEPELVIPVPDIHAPSVSRDLAQGMGWMKASDLAAQAAAHDNTVLQQDLDPS